MRRKFYLSLCLFMAAGLYACSPAQTAGADTASDQSKAEADKAADDAADDSESADSDDDTEDGDWYEELDSEDEDSSGDSSSEVVHAAGKDKVKDKDASSKKGLRLSYPQIDVSSLDNTAIPWGMGPSRDEFNRPVTALEYQNEYSQYNSDFIIPTEEKVVYLTFDEGYENGYTESILDTLNSHNAKGIFFVTYHYAESRPDLVKRMINEGHIVGNHTIHHPSDGMQAHDIDYQTHEVTDLHTYIKDNFDYDMYLFRYPTGMFSRQSLGVVSNCGYRSVFWSFAYKDWDPDQQPDPGEAIAKVESSLHPGAIYLLHAVSATNASILDEFLTYIEAQGYTVGDYAQTLN